MRSSARAAPGLISSSPTPCRAPASPISRMRVSASSRSCPTSLPPGLSAPSAISVATWARRRCAGLDQLRDVAPDAAVVVPVEVPGRDQVGDAVECLVVEEQPAEERLLRLDRVRAYLDRQVLR